MTKNLLQTVVVAFLVSALTLVGYNQLNSSKNENNIRVEHVDSTPAQSVLFSKDEDGEFSPVDFTQTAEKVNDAVVHIKSTQTAIANTQSPYGGRGGQVNPFEDEFFRQFFGTPNPQGQGRSRKAEPRVGTGSGVIINADGYIVTNNHVIKDADDIEVTLHDNRNYKATLVGTDPTTDLALLKIEETGLPKVNLSDSDKVRVGEWVLAVGNPFNLNSTVTAGIVSAKGRSINILQEQYAIESFIQTDAAINPGNSGGALVNLNGELVGINTAIASPTGSYSGYGFAVPSNIVSKVVEDLLKYGITQRGYMGVRIRPVDGTLVREKALAVNQGVYVDEATENGAAINSGIESGDVIVKVDNTVINSNPDLLEAIAQRRPGDAVEVTVNRGGTEKMFSVILNNRDGNTEIVQKELAKAFASLGANFETLDKETAQKLSIKGGIKVTDLQSGALTKQTNMQEGFIITKIDGKNVTDVVELEKYLDKKKGGVMLEGVYEEYPGSYYYAFGV